MYEITHSETIAPAGRQFRGCPECGGCNALDNVGLVHRLVCHWRRFRCWVGENILNSWRSEDERTRQENARRPAECREVLSIWPALPQDIRRAILNLIAYVWPDEEAGYWELHPSEREGHMFESVQLLVNWLTRNADADDAATMPMNTRGVPELMSTEETPSPVEDITHEPQQSAVESRYGGCPVCGNSSRSISLLGKNWLVCRTHRVKWCIGVGIFDTYSWEWTAWRTISRYLSFFREVEPIYGPARLAEGAERDER